MVMKMTLPGQMFSITKFFKVLDELQHQIQGRPSQ